MYFFSWRNTPNIVLWTDGNTPKIKSSQKLIDNSANSSNKKSLLYWRFLKEIKIHSFFRKKRDKINTIINSIFKLIKIDNQWLIQETTIKLTLKKTKNGGRN